MKTGWPWLAPSFQVALFKATGGQAASSPAAPAS